MPTPTYDLIASNVLGSSAASVTFSSIPATYRDLIVVCTITGSGGNGWFLLTFNSDTGSNYSRVNASGNGSTTASNTNTGTSIDIGYMGGFGTTNPCTTIIQALDYSATNKHKTCLIRQDNASQATEMAAGRWASTSAINSLTLTTAVQQFASGSTFYLYGISA